MASVYSAGQIADALLADAEFRALRLGTWLSTPSGELLAAAVTALTPPPFQQDIDLLIAALLALDHGFSAADGLRTSRALPQAYDPQFRTQLAEVTDRMLSQAA